MFAEYFPVIILVVINLINYMDRFTIAGLLDDIQKYFSINDKAAGLLQTAFICSYMIFSPLFGYLGDRYSRKIIIIVGVSFWSATTLLSSFIRGEHTYLFFLCRALVGIGEASYSTVAPTIIADLFVHGKRSTMLALFYFAIPVGGGLGYIAGIAMRNLFGEWQYALRLTPIFGVLSVLAFTFVKEPVRGQVENYSVTSTESESFNNPSVVVKNLKEDMRYLFSNPTYIFTSLGFTWVCFSIGALSWWAPKFMQYAINDENSPFLFGILSCLGGLLGVSIGYGASHYFRKRYQTADAWVCAIGVLVSIPFMILSIALARKCTTFAWISIFIAITCLSTNWSVVVDITLYVIIPPKRSTAQALQILCSHLFGDASSPFIIGIISDSFPEDVDDFTRLSYSLYLAPCILILAVIFFLFTTCYLVKDQNRCRQQMANSESESTLNPENDDSSAIFTNQLPQTPTTLIERRNLS